MWKSQDNHEGLNALPLKINGVCENLQKIARKSPGNLHGISKLSALAGTTFDPSLVAY
jgi:hypothetical protein